MSARESMRAGSAWMPTSTLIPNSFITSIVARLHAGGEMLGTVALDHWLPMIPGGAVLEAAAPAPAKHSRFGSKPSTQPSPQPQPPAKPLHPPPTEIPVNGKVTAQFRNVTLDTVLDIVSQRPFQRLGIDARLNGPATAIWTKGDTRTLSVSSVLSLSPSPIPVAGESPATGTIDGTYTQRDGAVDLRSLDVVLPASRLEARGHLGAYPISSPSAISVDFHSHDLGEFDTVLRDLGLRREGKAGTAALPGSVGGQAEFHGSWTGSLLDPHLAGSLNATNVTVELPAKPKDTTGTPQFVHWDSVKATGSYSGERISIDRGELTRGRATIDIQGTLAASMLPSKHGVRPSFDSNSDTPSPHECRQCWRRRIDAVHWRASSRDGTAQCSNPSRWSGARARRFRLGRAQSGNSLRRADCAHSCARQNYGPHRTTGVDHRGRSIRQRLRLRKFRLGLPSIPDESRRRQHRSRPDRGSTPSGDRCHGKPWLFNRRIGHVGRSASAGARECDQPGGQRRAGRRSAIRRPCGQPRDQLQPGHAFRVRVLCRAWRDRVKPRVHHARKARLFRNSISRHF